MSDKAKLIERLLAKAESTTPEEAEALTQAAERLMIKHGIDQAMIDAKRREAGAPTENIIEDRITYDTPYAVGLRNMAAAVVMGYPGVKCMRSGWKDHEVVYLVGYESDVKQCKLLLESLHLQSFSAMSKWWKEFLPMHRHLKNHARYMAKRQFLSSFGIGVRDRLEESRKSAETETPGSALVLRDRSAEVDAWISDNYHVGRGRANAGSRYGATEGRSAGRQANTGGTAIGGRTAALAR